MERESTFARKKVVVTGAGGVIGRWIAEAFHAAGARLCLTDRDGDGLDRLRPGLDRKDGGHLLHTGDLTDDAAIEALLALVRREWGAPDIVINNAAIYPSGFLLDTTTAAWDRLMGINLRAPFLVARGFARAMIAAGTRGCIVNISSAASARMRTTVVPYCTSKAALDRLSKGLALEFAEYGIRVNAIEPGFVPGSTVSPLSAAHIAAVQGSVPLGRPASARDITDAIMFLCSPQAAFITGATLSVDGGLSAGTTAVYQDKKSAL